MAKYLKIGDVELRTLEPEDFRVVHRWEGEIDAWMANSASAPFSRHTLWRYFKNYNCDIYSTHEVRMIVMLAGEPVGMLDVFNFDPMNSRAEVGVYVCAEHRRGGVGETAVRIAVENYAFGRLNLNQVYCTIRRSNEAALALFRQAGFTGETVLAQWISAGNGVFEDAVIMQRFSNRSPQPSL